MNRTQTTHKKINAPRAYGVAVLFQAGFAVTGPPSSRPDVTTVDRHFLPPSLHGAMADRQVSNSD